MSHKKIESGLYASRDGKEVVYVGVLLRMFRQHFRPVIRYLPYHERLGPVTLAAIRERWPLRVTGCVVE